MYVVEDFSETESIVMFKCHHALADGMSLIGLIACMQDHYNISQLYEFRPYIPCYKKVFMWICMPFCMVTALFHVLCRLSIQHNALTLENDQFSGIKKAAIGETLNVNDLKAVAKKNGASVNDLVMAMLAMSLHKYFKSKGKPEDSVTLGLPASFKKAAKTADQLKLINDLCPLFIELTLTDNF